MEKAQSFEVTEYDPEDLPVASQLAVIHQIMADKKSDPANPQLPTESFLLTLQGGEMRLSYHCYEMLLSDLQRRRNVEEAAEKALNEMLKHLKKEFKKRTKKVLSLKEIKDRRDYSVAKVSLNERYYYISWRVYSIDLAVR